MNKQNLASFFPSLILIGILGSLISTAKADDASIAVDNLVAGYGRQMTGTNNNQLFAPSNSVVFASTYGQVQINLTSPGSTMLIPLTPDSNGNVAMDATGPDLGQTAIKTLLTASKITIANYQQALNSALTSSPTPSPSDFEKNLGVYDIKSLLAPLGYTDQATAQKALLYIQFLAQPTFNADIATLRGYNSNNFLAYIMALRSYVATQSIGISNLYKSYSDRVRITGLGNRAGMKTGNTPVPDASVLEVEDYAAKKRVTDPNWYKAMETATPATIEREMLYVLAEMRLELYKNRLALERLILTNSAMQMQLTTLNSVGAASPTTLPQLKSQVNSPK
jgi:hypothetical protein